MKIFSTYVSLDEKLSFLSFERQNWFFLVVILFGCGFGNKIKSSKNLKNSLFNVFFSFRFDWCLLTSC